MSTSVPSVGSLRPIARNRLALRSKLGDWTAAAWVAIGATLLFIAITWWWLTQDRSIPIWDAGEHLLFSDEVHGSLAAGHIGKALTQTAPYPPFAYLIGTIAIVIAGFQVASPVVAENLVFVPLLALGCYGLAKRAFGATAGALAVVFALGSPLMIAQFHVFMIDAPETAMVAVSVWLIVATEGFSRPRVCVAAGIAVGLGMLTKEPFSLFVAGPAIVTAVRGGVKAWRGIALFAACALVLALPWYISELKQIHQIGNEATGSAEAVSQGVGLPPGIAPARMSLENWEWYLWSMINSQLYLPLFLFAAVGWGWTIVGFVRRRLVSPLAPELAVGAFVGWLGITETFVHDPRYGMPLLVYLAVFAAGWVVRLPGRARTAMSVVLVLVGIANTLGVTFGLGRNLTTRLPWHSKANLEGSGTITYFTTGGLLVGAPRRDGDLLAMLRALHREGIKDDVWLGEQAEGPEFSGIGVWDLSQIAHLRPGEVASFGALRNLTRADAVLAHEKVEAGAAPPCLRLSDGTGVWVRLGNPLARGAENYCPLPHPHFYREGKT